MDTKIQNRIKILLALAKAKKEKRKFGVSDYEKWIMNHIKKNR